MATAAERMKKGPSAKDRLTRTPSGAVAQSARDKFGAKAGGKLNEGSYPIASRKDAMNAIKLRRGDKGAVLDKVAGWAAKTGDKFIQMQVKAARKRDSASG